MRIAILSPYPAFRFQEQLGLAPTSYLNNATWTVTLARHLARLPDTEVHVVTETDNLPASQTLADEKVAVHFLKAPARFKTLTLWQFDRRRLHRALDTIQPDLVHGQGVETQYGYAAVTYPRPHLLTVHGIARLWNELYHVPMFSRAKLVEWMERRALARARNLVVINPFAVAVHQLDPARHRLFFIPNPVAEDFFTAVAEPREPDLIVSIGTLEPLKGFDLLLEAVAALRPRGLAPRVKIIGQCPPGNEDYVARLKQFGREAGLAVEFAGFLPPAEVAQALRRCTVMVHAARHEHAPMAVAEALSGGAAVIAADVGGVKHMLRDGQTGRLFPKEDVAALASQLAELLGDEPLRQRLGAAAREAAWQTYHPAAVARATRAAYADILGCA